MIPFLKGIEDFHFHEIPLETVQQSLGREQQDFIQKILFRFGFDEFFKLILPLPYLNEMDEPADQGCPQQSEQEGRQQLS